MKTNTSKLNTTYLKDYRVPDYLVDEVDLHFELGEDITIVHSMMRVRRNPDAKQPQPLVLQGEDLTLISVRVDDKPLTPKQYELTEHTLTIPLVTDNFTLEIITNIKPQENTTLSGLYRSKDLFCTQCEAEGFRRITYYLDRPDVMARFTTTLVADKTRYPVLLSNGNKIDQGDMENNRHWVKWEDPFKKPCYLFAMVAGNLVKIQDHFTTLSGRKVALEFFVEPENKDKCAHAVWSLKKAMQWDEENYGREYDLDIYMIVAVNDFNMGAMENKGLNIFNSKYVLADENTATDIDFQNVESVIGHEYFHNWTGNRITCRDWFQLSLKEGLTVFREQQFSASMGSPAVKRISDVRIIRTRQFAEDSGPMAHPVRPDAYIEINNFYTATIYHKGAEVIRMLHTLLGVEGFRKGMDLYFERHDGQAVTIEDFIAAHADANKIDLSQFFRWYQQAGTPVVKVTDAYDPKSQEYKLTFAQSCPQTPDKKTKQPFVIPIKVALYDAKGKSLKLDAEQLRQTKQGNYGIVKDSANEIVFKNIPEKPVPSLLGNFSAPIKLDYPYTAAELEMLMTSDEDLFNRWDACQRKSMLTITALMQDHKAQKALSVPTSFVSAFKKLLQQKITDPALCAQMLALPSFNYVAEELPIVEVEALIAARKAIIQAIAVNLQDEFSQVYEQCQQHDDGKLSGQSMGYRALKNVCLWYLIHSHVPHYAALAQAQYQHARNMTDKMGVLSALTDTTSPVREELFEDFYQQYQQVPLVVNKWLALHASSELPNVIDNLEALLQHKAFDISNPNKVYALINTFGMSNAVGFHEASGRGYAFVAKQVKVLNQRNPQVAARVIEPLTHWKRLDQKHGTMMKNALLEISQMGNLSEDIYEIVTKSLEE